ncbi:MAG: hypothetical protein B7X90_18050 [Novosphingobium sp. 17-62-19]|uniref:hypothetical protein n=1 Tax=Novosphingobium sp. 17-62-19 TaxID=1970406 RepID=UPI000BC8E26A|nr:hypothetical protein [Novosphingobium sp. 17-62-19]OZA16484.1 MAG: hypothetical protein B7X90_18050 [Novosphingobium sp. 17-62-19]
MSHVLVGIIGVIMFVGLAIAGANYYGGSVTGAKVDAQAADYLNQSGQIARAIEAYENDNGKPPVDGSGTQTVQVLVDSGYMSETPPGGRSAWAWDSSAKALLAVAGANDTEGLRVCIAARKRAAMPNPSQVKACDGSGGKLSKADPCCLK